MGRQPNEEVGWDESARPPGRILVSRGEYLTDNERSISRDARMAVVPEQVSEEPVTRSTELEVKLK